MQFTPIEGRSTVLKDTELLRRRTENRRYMMRLESDHLMLNYEFEAGLFSSADLPEGIHGGWEAPTCQLRGHFLGHWLSAAAMHYSATGDEEIKAKADRMVARLAHCQQQNGGEWAASFPEKYLHWIAEGKEVWAPQYTIHKTFMGLLDMAELTGNQQALEIAERFAQWFDRWSAGFTRKQFDDILDIETGGMLEIWAQLYGLTQKPVYRTLMERYYRGRLFDGLLGGQDVLTNMHANTTIPEVLGAAKAYEVTGEERWKQIVLAYWDQAVEQRASYATGGQTCGEIWTPPQMLSARLGEKNQEHCTVYNMMRLADILFCWTGDAKYADYWEQNLYNGIMAQGYWQGSFTHGRKSLWPDTGLLTYFLPMAAGSTKAWSSETQDFFCCHGSLVQANAQHNRGIYYQAADGIAVCQYLNSNMEIMFDGKKVGIKQDIDPLTGSFHLSSTSAGSQAINEVAARYPGNPNRIANYLTLELEEPVEFTLRIRIPWWILKEPVICLNGEKLKCTAEPSRFVEIRRVWQPGDQLYVELQQGITVSHLPDQPEMTAFLNGPVLLAGLTEEERMLHTGQETAEALLIPDNEREWASWKQTFRTRGQERGIRFIPLYQVGYEPYTVYFPVK